MTKKKTSNGLIGTVTDLVELNTSSVFDITIPYEFGLGKNEIKISLNSKYAKKGSEVLIDVVDRDGNIMYYEISPIANVDMSRSIIVEVDSETAPGKSSFIISTTLENNKSYKCVLNIDVIKGLESNSEIKFSSEPTVVYKERLLPTQQFTNVSRLVNRNFLGGTVSTVGTTPPKQLQDDPLQVEQSEITNKVSNNSVVGNIGRSSTQEVPSEFSLPIITSKNFAFSSSMKGGSILVRNINLEVPKDAASSAPFYFKNYSASILEINNTSSIQVFPSFFKKVEYIKIDGSVGTKTFDRFFNEGNFTASFYDTLTLAQSSYTQSYAVLDLYDLETSTGQIEKVQISYKSLNNLGTDFQPIGVFDVGNPNLLIDSASLFFDSELGIIEKPIGNFRNGITDFQNNWNTSSKGSFPVTSSTSNRIKDGIRIAQNPQNTDSAEFSTFSPKTYHSIKVVEGSKFEVKADVVFESDSALSPQLDVYISGSFVKSIEAGERVSFSPLQSASFGQYIGSLGRNKSITFIAEKTGTIRPIFIQRTGIWHIGNIELKPRKELGYNPNQSRVLVPMNINSGSEISIKIDYLNNRGQNSRYYTLLDKIYFTGSKSPSIGSTILPSGLVSSSDQLTSSYDTRYERKGTGIISSSQQIGPTGIYSGSGEVPYETRAILRDGSINQFETDATASLLFGVVNKYEELAGDGFKVFGLGVENPVDGTDVFIGFNEEAPSQQIILRATDAGGLSEALKIFSTGPIRGIVIASSGSGMRYASDISNSLLQQPLRIPDIRTVRKMFSSASLVSSSQQIQNFGFPSASGTDKQIPVFSGSNALSGSNNLQFDGKNLGVSGSIRIGNGTSVGSDTDPAIRLGNNVTGFFLDTNRLFAVANGVFGGGFASNGFQGNSALIDTINISSLVQPTFIPDRRTTSGLGSGLGGTNIGELALITNYLPRVYIHPSGSVGFGKINPQYNIDVSGSANIDNNLTVSGSLIVNKATGSFSGSFHGQYSSSRQVDYDQVINKINIKTPGNGRVITSDGTPSGSTANPSLSYVSSSTANRFRFNDMVQTERTVSSSFWTTEITYVTQSIHLCNNTNTNVYFTFPILKDSENYSAITSSIHHASYLVQVEVQLYGITGSLVSPMDTYSWGGTTQFRILANPKDMPSGIPAIARTVAVSSSAYPAMGGYGTTFAAKLDRNSWLTMPGAVYTSDGNIEVRNNLTTSSSFNWTIYAGAVCKVIKHEIRI